MHFKNSGYGFIINFTSNLTEKVKKNKEGLGSLSSVDNIPKNTHY